MDGYCLLQFLNEYCIVSTFSMKDNVKVIIKRFHNLDKTVECKNFLLPILIAARRKFNLIMTTILIIEVNQYIP